jgi:PGF-CTERM protein
MTRSDRPTYFIRINDYLIIMTVHHRIFVLFVLLAAILLPYAASALPAPVNASLSKESVTPGAPVTLSGTVPDGAEEMQVWTLACYKVTGIMSVPASCGAGVTTAKVNGTSFTYDLFTAEPGNYTVIAAFPGPDGTFGVGYDTAGRTLYYSANKTVIVNWSRSNPSDREEAAMITKAMESAGIENPSATLSYTVVTATGTEKTGTAVTVNATTRAEVTPAPAATSAAPSPTQVPGFGIVAALAGLTLVAGAISRMRR